MVPSWFAPVYAAVTHLTAVAALVVLMATSHLDTSVGFPLLAGLLGLGVGVPLTLGSAPTTPSTPVDPHTLP